MYYLFKFLYRLSTDLSYLLNSIGIEFSEAVTLAALTSFYQEVPHDLIPVITLANMIIVILYLMCFRYNFVIYLVNKFYKHSLGHQWFFSLECMQQEQAAEKALTHSEKGIRHCTVLEFLV